MFEQNCPLWYDSLFTNFFGCDRDSYKIVIEKDGDNQYLIGHNGYKAIAVVWDRPAPPDTDWGVQRPLMGILRECDLVMSWEYPRNLNKDLSLLRHNVVKMEIWPNRVEFSTMTGNWRTSETLSYPGSTGKYHHSYILRVEDLLSILHGPVLKMWEKAAPPLFLSTEVDGITRIMTVKPTLGEVARRNLKGA